MRNRHITFVCIYIRQHTANLMFGFTICFTKYKLKKILALYAYIYYIYKCVCVWVCLQIFSSNLSISLCIYYLSLSIYSLLCISSMFFISISLFKKLIENKLLWLILNWQSVWFIYNFFNFYTNSFFL